MCAIEKRQHSSLNVFLRQELVLNVVKLGRFIYWTTIKPDVSQSHCPAVPLIFDVGV